MFNSLSRRFRGAKRSAGEVSEDGDSTDPPSSPCYIHISPSSPETSLRRSATRPDDLGSELVFYSLPSSRANSPQVPRLAWDKGIRKSSLPGASYSSPEPRGRRRGSTLWWGGRRESDGVDTDAHTMSEDCDYWVIGGDQVEVDADFEVRRINDYESYLDEVLADEATRLSPTEYNYVIRELCKVRQTMLPAPIMKPHPREPPPGLEVAAPVTQANERLQLVQGLFPNDDLQLQKEGEKKVLKSSSGLVRRKSAPGALILKKSKQRSSSAMLPHDGATIAQEVTASAGSCNRVYILEGPVQLTNSVQAQDRYLFLFNDLLLVAKLRSSNVFRLKHRVHVCEMWTASCIDEVSETMRTPDKSFVMGWPTVNVVATFKTAEHKEEWLSRLQEQICEEKRKEDPNMISIRVTKKDEDHCVSKVLSVGNFEEAEDVVRRCIDAFNISDGSWYDYQLWVRSAKEESFYPLIGHEHPFSIQLSHLRETDRQTNSPNAHFDIDVPSLLCQFILRDNRRTPKKFSSDEHSRRMMKLKKSPLLTFFRKKLQERSPVQTPDVAGTESPPQYPPHGKLFGWPLSQICEANNIPKPIVELLQHLSIHGPYTVGIFRKCANQKQIRELRDLMDADENVSLDNISVLVAAAVLKEFLRNIPGGIFVSSLYDAWTETTQIADANERIEAVKQLLLQIPAANVLCLRHILSVLHLVSSKSNENHMTAYNLAVCIGHSLLWPTPTPATSPTPGFSDDGLSVMEQVPDFVRFFIEHCTDILGDDVPFLYADEAIAGNGIPDSSTDSDSMHSLSVFRDQRTNNKLSRQNDSSLDSLERDLYELDSSPQHLSPTNLSRDSGLTMSDTQLYQDDRVSAGGKVLRHSISHVEESKKATASSPVPPPRRVRRGGVRLVGGQIPTLLEHDTSLSMGKITLSHTQSTQSVPELDHMRPRLRDFPSRSLDEYPEISEDSSADDYLEFHDCRSDIGLLRRSESGGKIYVDEQLIHNARSDEKSPGGTRLQRHHSAKQRTLSPPCGLKPARHSFSDFSKLTDNCNTSVGQLSSQCKQSCDKQLTQFDHNHSKESLQKPPAVDKLAVEKPENEPSTIANEMSDRAFTPDQPADAACIDTEPVIAESLSAQSESTISEKAVSNCVQPPSMEDASQLLADTLSSMAVMKRAMSSMKEARLMKQEQQQKQQQSQQVEKQQQQEQQRTQPQHAAPLLPLQHVVNFHVPTTNAMDVSPTTSTNVHRTRSRCKGMTARGADLFPTQVLPHLSVKCVDCEQPRTADFRPEAVHRQNVLTRQSSVTSSLGPTSPVSCDGVEPSSSCDDHVSLPSHDKPARPVASGSNARSMSPVHFKNSKRPISPVQFSNPKRPMSPVHLTNPKRPMSPVQVTTPRRPNSPVLFTNAKQPNSPLQFTNPNQPKGLVQFTNPKRSNSPVLFTNPKQSISPQNSLLPSSPSDETPSLSPDCHLRNSKPEGLLCPSSPHNRSVSPIRSTSPNEVIETALSVDGSHTMTISKKDAVQQSINSARAKRMYEESLQRYSCELQEHNSSANSTVDKVDGDTLPLAPQTTTSQLSCESSGERLPALSHASRHEVVNRPSATEDQHTPRQTDSETAKSDDCAKRSVRARRRLAEMNRARRLSDTKLCSDGFRLADMPGEPNLNRSNSDSYRHMLIRYRQTSDSSDDCAESAQDSIHTRSLRNKSWHKQLAEKYSQPCYQATRRPHRRTTYSYNAPNASTDNRRWMPLVHPTKHLVVHPASQSDDSECDLRHRTTTTTSMDASRTEHLPVQCRNAVTGAYRPANNWQGAQDTRPWKGSSLETRRASSSETPSESPSNSELESSPTHNCEPGFSWSVRKLRGIYATPRVNTPSY